MPGGGGGGGRSLNEFWPLVQPRAILPPFGHCVEEVAAHFVFPLRLQAPQSLHCARPARRPPPPPAMILGPWHCPPPCALRIHRALLRCGRNALDGGGHIAVQHPAVRGRSLSGANPQALLRRRSFRIDEHSEHGALLAEFRASGPECAPVGGTTSGSYCRLFNPTNVSGRGGSAHSGSTFRAEINWHKSGQVLHFCFKNSVPSPQNTFPLVAVLLESCGITTSPSIFEKISPSVSFYAVFAPCSSRESGHHSGVCTVLLFGKSFTLSAFLDIVPESGPVELCPLSSSRGVPGERAEAHIPPRSYTPQ